MRLVTSYPTWRLLRGDYHHPAPDHAAATGSGPTKPAESVATASDLARIDAFATDCDRCSPGKVSGPALMDAVARRLHRKVHGSPTTRYQAIRDGTHARVSLV